MKKIELTRLSEIRWDREHQARAGMNEEVIADYAEAMGRERERIEAGELVWPPLEVVQDAVSMEMWGWDGHHRSQAAARAGLELFPAIRTVAEDAKAMAQWLACGANQAHGLRRTNEDKRRAVEMALGMHPEMSDRSLATHCGVSNVFVSKLRCVLTVNTQDEPQTRVRADGRTFTVAPKAAPAGAEADPTPNADQARAAHDIMWNYTRPAVVLRSVDGRDMLWHYGPDGWCKVEFSPVESASSIALEMVKKGFVLLDAGGKVMFPKEWPPTVSVPWPKPPPYDGNVATAPAAPADMDAAALCSKDCIAKLESAPAARPDTLAARRQYERDVTAAFNLGCSHGRAMAKMERPENHDQCNAYTDGYKQGQASAEDDCVQAHKDGYAEGVAGRPDLCPFAESISPKATALAKHWRSGFEAGQQYRATMAATGLVGNDDDDDEAQDQPPAAAEESHGSAYVAPPRVPLSCGAMPNENGVFDTAGHGVVVSTFRDGKVEAAVFLAELKTGEWISSEQYDIKAQPYGGHNSPLTARNPYSKKRWAAISAVDVIEMQLAPLLDDPARKGHCKSIKAVLDQMSKWLDDCFAESAAPADKLEAPARPSPARAAAHAASGDVPPPPMLVKCECEHTGESHHGEGGRCMLPWCQCQGFEAHPDSEEPDWDGGTDYDSLMEVFDRLSEPLGKAQWMRALMAMQTLVERVFLADAPMGWIQTRDDIHAAKNAIGDAVRMANRMDGHLEAQCAKLRPKR